MADYQQGKHKGAAGAPAVGGFGAPAATGGAFGAPAATGFGGGAFGAAATGGAFGAAAPATGGFGGFGAAASSAATGGFGGFGAAATGGFGAAKPAFGGFGAASTGAATGGFGGFGAAASTGGFGAAASTGGFGGFGASTGAATGGFGGFGAKPATGGFGGFGAAASSGGFGAAASSGGFGGFGASSGAATGGFGGFGASTGAATGGFGGFGAKPATAGFGGFGAAASTGGFGGFGASTGAATGGFGGFGAKPATGGFGGFGASTGAGFGGFGAKPATSSFGSFGAPAAGGAFGMGMQQPMAAAAGMGMGMVNPAAQMQMQMAMVGGMQTETNPLGPSPFDKTAPPPIATSKPAATKTTTAVVFPDTKRSTEFVNTQARSGSRRGANGSTSMRPRTSRLASPAQEAISSPGRTPRRRAGLSDSRVPADESYGEGALSISASWAADPRVLTMELPPPIDTTTAAGNGGNQSGKDLTESEEEEEDDGYSLEKKKLSPPPVGRAGPEVQTGLRAPYEPSKLNQKWKNPSESEGDDYPRIPSDCACKPSVEDIRSMPESERKRVEDFTIFKDDFGAICFEGYTDTTSLDLTTSIPGEGMVMWEGERGACTGVVLYPEELLQRLGKSKPVQGEELNKPAEITLNFQPNWKVEDIREGIDNGAENDGDKMKFVSYNEQDGQLKFRVKHFTRWGLSAAVMDEATPRGRTGVDDSMDDSDAENMPTESFLKIGGHSSVRITPGSERRFAKSATTEHADGVSMHEDETSSEHVGGADDTVRKALEALGPSRDVFRQDEATGDMQRSFFRGMANDADKSTLDGSGAFAPDKFADTPMQSTTTELVSGAIVVVPDPAPAAPSMEDFPVTATDPIMMPTRDPREDLELPHESHEYSTNDGVVLNRDDFGARMGRSFRVGWGPGGMLIYNFTCPPGEESTTPIGTLQMQTVSVSEMTGDSGSDEAMTRDLSIRLAHYKREAGVMVDEDESAAAERLLEQYLSSCDSDTEKPVWQLVQCLYLGDTSKDVRQAVSTWLQQVTKSSSAKPSLVELLACRQIEEACEAAVEKRDFRLAALIAQADSPSELRGDVQKQVKCWKQAAYPSTLGPGTFWSQMKAPERHVYGILSGDFDTLQADLGISPETLGWRSCLGLHMWYKFGGGVQSRTALEQLHTVMDSYDAAWQIKKAPRPRPSYASPSCPQDQPHDVCYSLLQSYARAPVALDPRAHRPSVLDCSFVWHLQRLLAEIPALEGNTVAALPPQKLHTDFILQLEARGLLRWAIYVATQWRPETSAHASVSLEQTPLALELLCRYAPALSDEDLAWLQDEVELPLGWLTYARAIMAASIGDAVEESIRLAETLGQMGGTSNLWPFRRPLLAFAQQMQSTLAPEVVLLVDTDADAHSAAAPSPFAEPLCRWARQRLRAVALSRLAPCFAAASRRRPGGEDDLGGTLTRLLQLLNTISTQADLALPSAAVRMTAAVGVSACTACALEGAFRASQVVRERVAAAAVYDGRRSPTRPRLSPDPDSSPTAAAMDEDESQSDDLWCAACYSPPVSPSVCLRACLSASLTCSTPRMQACREGRSAGAAAVTQPPAARIQPDRSVPGACTAPRFCDPRRAGAPAVLCVCCGSLSLSLCVC